MTTQFAARAFWAIEESAQQLENVADDFWAMGTGQPNEQDRMTTYSLADSYRMAANEVRLQIPAYQLMKERNLAAIKAWDKASAGPKMERWDAMKYAPGGIGPDFSVPSPTAPVPQPASPAPAVVRRFLVDLMERSERDNAMFPQVASKVAADNAALKLVLHTLDWYYPAALSAAGVAVTLNLEKP